jgi:thiol-disulfide isomerase/thioredoxin
MNDMYRRLGVFGSKSPMSAAIIYAGVIITAAVGVASGASPLTAAESAPKAAEKAPTKPKSGTVIWHETPKALPATVFKDVADADRTLDKFTGKVLLVNFWATWCAPCVKEMPTLDALQAKMGGPDFEVLAISQDREGAKVAQPFAEKQGWKNLAFYVEKMGRFSRDANLRGLPTTLLIDKSGKEVARVEGEADWSSPEIEKILRDLIAKK